jgi:hypothetical protein
MFLSRRSTRLTLSAFAFGFVAFSASLGARGQGPGDGSELSGPAQMNLVYQARNPRLCKPVSAPPSPGQAAVLMQTPPVPCITGLAQSPTPARQLRHRLRLNSFLHCLAVHFAHFFDFFRRALSVEIPVPAYICR